MLVSGGGKGGRDGVLRKRLDSAKGGHDEGDAQRVQIRQDAQRSQRLGLLGVAVQLQRQAAQLRPEAGDSGDAPDGSVTAAGEA